MWLASQLISSLEVLSTYINMSDRTMRSNEGGAYTRSAALTEGQVSGVLAPAHSPTASGTHPNRGPDFIGLAKLGTFPYAFPRERGAETATVAQ